MPEPTHGNQGIQAALYKIDPPTNSSQKSYNIHSRQTRRLPEPTQSSQGTQAAPHFIQQQARLMDLPCWESLSERGNRNTNQDVILEFSHPNIAFVAVLDGHGLEGREVAQLAANLLKKKIQDNLCYTWNATDLAQTIMDIDKNLYGLRGGSTIACALFQHATNVLLVANAGDSHIVLSQNGKAKRLSETHNTTNDNERDRITSKGGFIINHRVAGTHQVTRGLGDCSLKSYIIPDPYIREIKLEKEHEFLIIGSDGVSSKIIIQVLC